MLSFAPQQQVAYDSWMAADDSHDNAECIFCNIVSGRGRASVVYEDDTVIAFMDLHPVTPGHLLVVPRIHAVGLEDLDEATSAHVWTVGHRLSKTLRRSAFQPEGINTLLCDGEAAFQTVFHFHLHVIPRYTGDSWDAVPESTIARDRALLDRDAHTIRSTM